MADAGSNLGKLTPKYDFSQYRYREIASRSLTIKWHFNTPTLHDIIVLNWTQDQEITNVDIV